VNEFPDSMLATVSVLRSSLGEDVEVGTRIPTDRRSSSAKPYVLVRLDGSSLNRKVREVSDLRVSVWHSSEFASLALAQTCRAILLGFSGDEQVSNFRPGSGPIPTSDPETAEPLSFFTISAHMRPTTT
jgi:hypothetical protein